MDPLLLFLQNRSSTGTMRPCAAPLEENTTDDRRTSSEGGGSSKTENSKSKWHGFRGKHAKDGASTRAAEQHQRDHISSAELFSTFALSRGTLLSVHLETIAANHFRRLASEETGAMKRERSIDENGGRRHRERFSKPVQSSWILLTSLLPWCFRTFTFMNAPNIVAFASIHGRDRCHASAGRLLS